MASEQQDETELTKFHELILDKNSKNMVAKDSFKCGASKIMSPKRLYHSSSKVKI